MAGALEGDIFIGPKAEVCGMLQMKTVTLHRKTYTNDLPLNGLKR